MSLSRMDIVADWILHSPDLNHTVNYKRKEAEWKRKCSDLHKEFCWCGDWTNHITKKCHFGGGSGAGDGGDPSGGTTIGGIATGGGADAENGVTDEECLR